VKVLYVSPHPDDVAFSASARLLADRAAGHDVIVVTLFAPAGGPDAVGDAAARAAEDERFAALTGARLVAGGFTDAIVRRPRYRSLRRLFGPLAADEEPLVEEVRARLESFAAGRVVAPLGVGDHVDHQIAHAAARRLKSAQILYYEDVPYVLTPYRLARRLDALGLAADGVARGNFIQELAASARAWRRTPLLAALAPHPWLALAGILVQTELLKKSTTGRAISGQARAEVVAGEGKLEAIACYPSQWRLFFPSLEAWRDALLGHAATMGRDTLVERAWSIDTGAAGH
jgi:LmbE family N-acetylglucosaminyl deacetylase